MANQESSGVKGFGCRIRKLRQRLGLSVANFAAAVEFDRTYIHRIESGEAKNPSLKFIDSVVRVFGVDHEWLVNGKDESYPLEMKVRPGKTIDAYLRMLCEVLIDLVETYDEKELGKAAAQFKKLAQRDQEFGKLFDQVSNIISYVEVRRMTTGFTKKIK